MRFISLVLAAFVVTSGAQTIGPGPYSADAILALFGVSVSKRQTTIPSECTPVCDPIVNNIDTSDCPTSVCCTSTFIKSYHTCLGCVSKVLDGSNSTSATKAAVEQLLTTCIQEGALPSTSQGHTKQNSNTQTQSSQTAPQPSATEASATGSGVVTVPPVVSPTGSSSEASATSAGATPTSTNSAIRTTLGRAYGGIASVLIWAILQMM